MMAVLRRSVEFVKTNQGESPTIPQQDSPADFTDINGHWASSVITLMSSYCDVASAFQERGSSFEPNRAAQRNYAAAATLRAVQCLKSE
jgi:hypothetical protein